jgi:hypothetical protein
VGKAAQNMRKLWRSLLLGGLLAAVAGCATKPDEAALRQRIEAMIEAVEAREPRRFMEGVTEDFGGDHGLSREGLQGVLRAQLLRNARIGVSVLSTEITLHGERATVVHQVLLTGGEGGLIPDRYRRMRIESGWRFEEGDWRVYVARWEGGG